MQAGITANFIITDTAPKQPCIICLGTIDPEEGYFQFEVSFPVVQSLLFDGPCMTMLLQSAQEVYALFLEDDDEESTEALN